MDAIKKPSLNKVRKQKARDESFTSSEGLMALLKQAIDIGDDGKIKTSSLKVLREKQVPTLKPFTDPQAPTSDPRTWEVLSAVVDSGSTVPAFSPKVGRGYKVEESAASRQGVEYETAGGGTLPDLGEKKLAVITPEGTLRGYRSNVADVTGPLQSVRSMVNSRHCVLFGLGPNDDEHLIINKISGEVNRMRDDGVNYLQDLLVVPPGHLEAVMEQMNDAAQADEWPQAPFGRQG